jgi:hypothetical protein
MPWLKPTFSPEQLFECGGATCNQGWEPDGAVSFLEQTGIVDEACMPYTSGATGNDVACSTECSDSSTRAIKITGSTQPSSMFSSSVVAVKAGLKNGPLITTLSVYADFLTYSSGVYTHVTGDMEGGHAVSIIGYDDDKQAWLIRNSWGVGWGMNGFAWVSWNDVSGVGGETWSLQLPSANAFLSVQSPGDREFVSGKYTLSLNANGVNALTSTFHLTGPDGSTLPSIACSTATASGCSAQWDTTQVAEGRYEIYADASVSGVRSQVREFFVINSVPQMSLSMQPASGVDLSQPQNGRPEFNITATYSPVPMQDVQFQVLDSTGKVISYADNPFVIPSMTIGWRTMDAANGTYTVRAQGTTTYKGQVYTVNSNTFQMIIQNQ